ncbi:MAG: hypothetical protein M3Z24_07965 [Chloroflexota bacterium]|nr:hypothetical protein [Chloroflexota bacterium]
MMQDAKRDQDGPGAQRGRIHDEGHLCLAGPSSQEHGHERLPQLVRIDMLVGEKTADGALLTAGSRAADTPKHLGHLGTGHALGQHDPDDQPAERLAAMPMKVGHDLLDNLGELLAYCVNGCLHRWSPFTLESFVFRFLLSLWTETRCSASKRAVCSFPFRLAAPSHALLPDPLLLLPLLLLSRPPPLALPISVGE